MVLHAFAGFAFVCLVCSARLFFFAQSNPVLLFDQVIFLSYSFHRPWLLLADILNRSLKFAVTSRRILEHVPCVPLL